VPVPRIVIAEDDPAVRELLGHHFERAGYSVVGVSDGMAALRAARNAADLLILDVGIPVLDGFDVARKLRREGLNLPILILTARTDEVDRVVGLELGADDYVVKPFSPFEVVARVKAILRRANQECETAPALLEFGRLQIDERAREARVDGCDVDLKPREFSLLLELAMHPGVALSRKQLLDRVWGFDFVGDERTVDVHVRRLRAKIEERWDVPPLVATVHGYGYKFVRA
jgi:two-component system, OmpR family, alkaline phosphatase synthesis response regulator PhoP